MGVSREQKLVSLLGWGLGYDVLNATLWAYGGFLRPGFLYFCENRISFSQFTGLAFNFWLLHHGHMRCSARGCTASISPRDLICWSVDMGNTSEIELGQYVPTRWAPTILVSVNPLIMAFINAKIPARQSQGRSMPSCPSYVMECTDAWNIVSKQLYSWPAPPPKEDSCKSVDVMVCRPSSGHTWTYLEEATRGRDTLKRLFSPWCQMCVCVCLCTQPWALTWETFRALILPLVTSVQGAGAFCTVRSTPHTQATVSTRDTRRQRMSHFTHSWKGWCVSLCHLELPLSAGVWCVEGKGSGRRYGLVWGLLLPPLKSLSGQGLSYLQKREENSGDGRDWHTVLLVQ